MAEDVSFKDSKFNFLQARREQLRRQQDDIIETLAELDQLEDQSRGLLADREARRKAVG